MEVMIFNLPTRIYFGDADFFAIDDSHKKILVVASHFLKKATTDIISQKLCSNATVITGIVKEPGEPTTETIAGIIKRSRQTGFDAVIGIGGGSVLDTAKAVALLKKSGGNINDYEFSSEKIKGALPIYAIPTTCGSGSEVTPYCVITNAETGRKFTITHDSLRPLKAYIDPVFIKELPRQTMLASALDAFTHNLEATLNVNVNPLISPLALEGLRLIYHNLKRAVKLPVVPDEICRRLAMASLYGGISITHSRTGLTHTMSAAFAEFSKEPHGLLNAKLLPYVLRYNIKHYNGKLADTATRITGLDFRSDQDAGVHISTWLQDLLDGRQTISGCRKVAANKDHVSERVLQDKGLPRVNAAPISRRLIKQLIGNITDEQR